MGVYCKWDLNKISETCMRNTNDTSFYLFIYFIVCKCPNSFPRPLSSSDSEVLARAIASPVLEFNQG